MNVQKKVLHNMGNYIHVTIYIILVLLASMIFQLFTNRILCRYELFLTANYDDLLVNLFTAQVTIIILPLSLFGIFTETTNEVYLGQSIAEYLYIYRDKHFFAFRYKELIISSMMLTLAEYVLMSKELLAAELITLILNTTAMLTSLFSWIDVRIKKEKFHTFIRTQLCTKLELNNTHEKETILIELLSKLKNWVINGGDYELHEAMQFYGTINFYSCFWDIQNLIQNTEKKEFESEIFSSYKNANYYFDELVVDLLRKQDYYRALRCSKDMLKIIAQYREWNYYCPNHYHYRILLNLFRTMNEMEIELLGPGWFNNYLVTILMISNVNEFPTLTTQTKETRTPEELQKIIEVSYILVYEFLMSIWQNDNLTPEYKQKQMDEFLINSRLGLAMNNAFLCVKMKLMETKEQMIIDKVVKETWHSLEFPLGYSLPKEKEKQEFLEKSMILILAYSYYLTAYAEQDITIPQLEIGFVRRYSMWEVLIDCTWKQFDEIKEFLDKNYKLDENFRFKYYNVIYEIMLYSAITNKQFPIPVKNITNGYNKVISYFSPITGSDKHLNAAISRYKKYMDLFGVKDEITDQMIDDQFYELKKIILQYYIEPVKKTAAKFDKEAFWEKVKEKVWEELLIDHRFVTNPSNVQVSDKDVVVEEEFKQAYLILPHEKNFDIQLIKDCLCGHIFQKVVDKKKTCDVLLLEWKDEELNDKEIEIFIEKGQEFKVKACFYSLGVNNIFAMNFRTHEEAYKFIKSEYRKIVFLLKVKI